MKLFLFAGVTLLTAAALPLRADVSQREMNYGYALLHHLCDEEAQVDMIMIVKTTPPDVAALVREISKSAKEDLDILDRFADRDPALRFEQRGLPEIESQTRDSIKAEKQHLLLFGTKDKDFAQTLLLTQVEASTYGENMAKVMAEDETNPHRAEGLRRISRNWEAIKNKVYALIYRG
jgi:hypothetical protein